MPNLIPVKQEIKNALNIIAQLKDYESRNWAIGMNGDTMQPDNILAFFSARELRFEYYFINRGITIGSVAAYKANISVCEEYIKAIKSQEMKSVNSTIDELKSYQSKNWAIGLNGDTLQPDGFLPFFAQRGLPFEYYCLNTKPPLGHGDAYDKNIKTLQNHISSLEL